MSTRKPPEDERRFARVPRRRSKREREEGQRQLEALIAQRKAAERVLGPPTNPYDFLMRRVWELNFQEGMEILEIFKKKLRRAATEAKSPNGSDGKNALADLIASDIPFWKQALVDLVASDVSLDLDADMRRAIANELTRLYEGEKRLRESERERSNPKWRNQRDLETARGAQDHLEKYAGMTATVAEQAAAQIIGLSVDALRKRRERARKQKQGAR